MENNVRVAKLSVSTFLSRWSNSRSEIVSVQTLVLTHFNIIEIPVCKTLTRLRKERYAKRRQGFAKKNRQSLVTVLHTSGLTILK